MKKFLACALVLTLALPCAAALAEAVNVIEYLELAAARYVSETGDALGVLGENPKRGSLINSSFGSFELNDELGITKLTICVYRLDSSEEDIEAQWFKASAALSALMYSAADDKEGRLAHKWHANYRASETLNDMTYFVTNDTNADLFFSGTPIHCLVDSNYTYELEYSTRSNNIYLHAYLKTY